MSSPACIIGGTPYPSLNLALDAEGIELSLDEIETVERNLRLGNAVQVGDLPTIYPDLVIVCL